MELEAMSLQLGFAFQPKAADDEPIFVPSHAALMAWFAGEVSDEEIGLHNFYACGRERENCPQCDARLEACFDYEASLDEFRGSFE